MKFVPSLVDHIAEVQYSRHSVNFRIFNVIDKTCSCNKMKEFGYPCEHFYSMMFNFSLNETEYILPSRKINSNKKIYSGTSVPVDQSNLTKGVIRAAIQRSRRGRKRRSERRIISVSERISKREIKCSICSLVSHNKRTCPNIRQ